MATKTAAKKSAAKKAAKKAAPAAKKTASAKTAAVDATALLIQDHRDASDLFEQYKKLVDKEAGADERQAIAERVCMLLTVHAEIEEEIFYPAARDADVDSDLLDEAEVEHASAKDLIAQIQSMQPDDDLYDAKVTVLGEYINHHVQEEESEMFPKCKKSSMDLEALGEELSERKVALMADASDSSEAD